MDDAAIMELEPLSEDAAAEYVDPDNVSVDESWLDWIIETAGLTELPLYLQITRQLSRYAGSITSRPIGPPGWTYAAWTAQDYGCTCSTPG